MATLRSGQPRDDWRIPIRLAHYNQIRPKASMMQRRYQPGPNEVSMSQDRNPLFKMAAASFVLLAPFVRTAEPSDVWSRTEASRVCPIATVWRMGTGPGRSPAEMIETVVPLEVDGRAVWRIMHTMARSAEEIRNGMTPGSDVLDVERATLAPLQGEHRTRGSADTAVSVTRFDYRATPGTVLRLNADGSPAERIALQPGQRVLAEGPGVAVLDQAIAWSDGLKLRGYMIDRWRGREKERLREIEITVTGRGSVEIGARRVETFVVTERPVDGAYHWVRQITVERPHRHVHSLYYSAGLKEGARPFISEASALLKDASCTKTE